MQDLFGDGFAFWYVRDRMEMGPVFGSKDHFSGLAIMADTYSNHLSPSKHTHPYLSAMVNNGSLAYDHDKDGSLTMIGGCEAKFRNLQHETWLSVRYEDDKLTVSHDLENKRAWKQCLSIPNVRLPTGYYFGLTATTGDLIDAHDILGIKTYELDMERPHIVPETPDVVLKLHEKEKPKEESASWSGTKKFFIGLLVTLGTIVLVIDRIMIYQNQQEQQAVLQSLKCEVLLSASEDGNLGRVQVLLAQGVNPNTQNGKGETPLMLSAWFDRKGVVECLLGHPNIDLEVRDQAGSTALLEAAASGNPQVVQLLLAGGADTAVVDNSGYTLLMEAAWGGEEAVVELALNQPNIDLEAMSVHGETALLVAAEEGHKQVVLQLLARGANPAVEDHRGNTMLRWAQENGWVDLAAQFFAYPGP